MYIRRKVFSILTDEMGEERLYSVNETVFEGYEEREFAKKEDVEPKTDKLRFMDTVEYGVDKYLTPKQVRKAAQAATEGKAGKAMIEGGKIYVPVGTVAGALAGGLATKSVKGALAGAGVGAAAGAGATAGTGLGAVGVRVGRKISPRYEELADRRVDQYKMASGEMSKKDFKKKHYNKKRIERLNKK